MKAPCAPPICLALARRVCLASTGIVGQGAFYFDEERTRREGDQAFVLNVHVAHFSTDQMPSARPEYQSTTVLLLLVDPVYVAFK